MTALLITLTLLAVPVQRAPDIARPELLSSEDRLAPIEEAALLAFVENRSIR